MAKPIVVKFPPDLHNIVRYALRAYEKQVRREMTDENRAITALMLSDIRQVKRVMTGLDRFDESKDDEIV